MWLSVVPPEADQLCPVIGRGLETISGGRGASQLAKNFEGFLSCMRRLGLWWGIWINLVV